MSLRLRLTAGFLIVSGFTLVAAVIGIWQTQRLARGLYEVGVVRLPSIQALQTIFESKTALDASKRELMRGWVNARHPADTAAESPGPAPEDRPDDVRPPLSPDRTSALLPHDTRELWRAVLTEELRRQGDAWKRAASAWETYEAQPRTPEEDARWRAFARSWTDWRSSYQAVMENLVLTRDTGSREALAAAERENQERLYTLARESRLLLEELIDLSDSLASQAKETSIASHADAMTLRRMMLLTAAASVLGAIVSGALVIRRITGGIRPMAAAFERIAAGDFSTRVPVTADDEIGHMAGSMNRMVGTLESSESARARASAELADTAARLALALRISHLGLWRRNILTNEAEWDAQMFVLFGLPPGPTAPTRETILSLVVLDDRPGVLARWSKTPAVGETVRFRFRITRPDGKQRHLEAHGIVQADAGRPTEWTLGVVADITEITEAATESARLRERLSQAHKMESLGALAAGVAHDFNNLLTGIGGFIELAAISLPQRHEAKELLAEARNGAHSARDLVTRILAYARDSRGTHRVMLELEHIVRQAHPLIAAALPANIEITLQAGHDLPVISADPGQIQQILMNLCTNAAHAIGTPGGRIEIHLRAAQVDRTLPGHPDCTPGRYVCLSVTDNGSGMDEAIVGEIFEPYFTTKGPAEGTGLGLSNVRDIVAAHGGGLTVDTAKGRGTTFAIYLPVGNGTQGAGI